VEVDQPSLWVDEESAVAQILPPGLLYFPNWLSNDEHDLVMSEIDSRNFDNTLSRRVQHYGTRYDYKSAALDRQGSAPMIPPVISLFCKRLVSVGLFEVEPDQVIVNEYLTGQGIAKHIDKSSFGAQVATISLCESWPMVFNGPNGETISKVLECRSLAVMTGDARYKWTHQITKRKSDLVGKSRVRRVRRVSLTFRTILIADKNIADSC